MQDSGDLNSLLSEIKARQAAAEPTNYDKFLKALASGSYPRFCELVWDGEVFSVVLTVHFQKVPEREASGPPAGSEAIRRRAWSYFKQFDDSERRLMQFRVMVKEWLPVHAVVTMRPDAVSLLRIGTDRLMGLQAPHFSG
ncbi:MAG: hypothetical protein BroJett011_03730 [Chloroflexota bacterium]|nr:MAG: hypothetical protein BroJett011_03730 [Chloroflexota bacterium]